jgi:predicted RNA-binding Zn-ribbon protein involved in translation (DUF1610 family)
MPVDPFVGENAIAFRCPNCDKEYKLVRVAAPLRRERELLCQGCGGPLRNREGKFALKYFPAEESRRRPDRARRPIW